MRQHTILVVEDDAMMLDFLDSVCRGQGWNTILADSGEKAVEFLAVKNCDLVITDLHMKKTDGIAVLKKAREKDPFMPVIILSGDGKIDSALRAFRNGARDYLLKPTRVQILQQRVTACLEQAEQLRRQERVVEIAGDARAQCVNLMRAMSHDLRSPLLGMLGDLAGLRKTARGNSDSNTVAVIEKMAASCRKQMERIDEFLDVIFLLDNDRPLREELDLDWDVLAPVVRELAPEMQDKKITLHCQVMPAVQSKGFMVHGCRVQLQSVFRNLLSNAIKYGETGGAIEVALRQAAENHCFQVGNSGTAIPRKYQTQLFEKFQPRGSGSLRCGAGVGLHISREMVRWHGGDLWYEAAGNGPTFVFSLPAEKRVDRGVSVN